MQLNPQVRSTDLQLNPVCTQRHGQRLNAAAANGETGGLQKIDRASALHGQAVLMGRDRAAVLPLPASLCFRYHGNDSMRFFTRDKLILPSGSGLQFGCATKV